jgi:hypothetical protein
LKLKLKKCMKEDDVWNIVGFGTEACGKELEITEATKRDSGRRGV